jgi:hypothetical protein
VLRQSRATARLHQLLRAPGTIPVLVILAAVVAANLPTLLHLVTTNPLLLNAELAPPTHGVLPGVPYTDPNAGYTTQALGHRAALDWLHGHIPWWNPYEGAGAPLAGEMQGGAFFPPVLLLAAHAGLLAMQVLLEAVAGWATYFLVRRLGVGRTLSTAAGVAFGLCGTFAWIAHAPMRPVAFLPLCLVGVERAVEAGRERRPGGWRLLALALALSILAGFPETTLIDGLLVGWWAVLRLVGPGREVWRAVMGKLAAGLAVGVGLALPLLAAFVAYLPSSDLGAHSAGFAYAAIPTLGLVQDVLPYSLGPISGFTQAHPPDPTLGDIWGNTGGFVSATVVAGALVGLVGRRQRLLRLGLAGWIAVCLLRTYGDPTVLRAMAAVPGLKAVAFFRYANPSWVLAAVVLAALGLDDVARRRTTKPVLVAGVGVTAGLATWAAVTAWPALVGATAGPAERGTHPHAYVVVSLAGAFAALAALAVGGLMAAGKVPGAHAARRNVRREDRLRRTGRALVAVAVATESVVLFGCIYLSAPPPTPLQAGSVTWLQAHLGTQRFFTLGPIQPDYGSYFGIAQVNVNDLPLPKSWNDYIASRLDPNSERNNFTGWLSADPSGPSPAEELTSHLAAYEAIGVRYVVESADGLDSYGRPFPQPGTPRWPAGPRLVHRDTFAAIWELPGAAPVFTAVTGATGRVAVGATTSPGCTVAGRGWDDVTVDCPRPATVLRRVQYVPGWTATADGEPVEVRPVGGGPFQSVTVAAGRTTVHFTYLPPHAGAAVGVAASALVVLVASLVAPKLRARRGVRVRRRDRAPGDGDDDPLGGPDPAGAPDGSRGDAI